MTKFLICTDLYPSSDVRGKADQTHAVKNLLESASKQGMEIVAVIRFRQLLSKKPIFRVKSFYLNGIKIIDAPILGYRDWFVGYVTRLILRKELKSLDYDAIISHMSMSFVRAESVLNDMRKRRRHFLVVHQGDFKLRCLRTAILRSDAIFSRSPSINNKLGRYYDRVKCNGILYSGIDDTFFQSPLRTKLICKPTVKTVRFIYYGNLIPLKNIDKVVWAMRILIDKGWQLKLTIIGHGPAENIIQKQIADLNLERYVTLIGWCGKTELVRYLDDSDVFVMPSKPETFGLAYLEAMARGCVVLGHKGEGIDGIVTDGHNGLLVDRADSAVIASKLHDFLSSDLETRALMFNRSRMTASRYTSDAAGANYLKHVMQAFNYH